MSCTRSWAKAARGSSVKAKTDLLRTQSAADLSKAISRSTAFVRVSPLSIALPSTSGFPVSGGAFAVFVRTPDEDSQGTCFGSQAGHAARDGARSVMVRFSASRRNVRTCPDRASGTVATKPAAVSTTVAFQPMAPSVFAP